MRGVALASGDFGNGVREEVGGVYVAIFVDCNPVWSCAGSSENCGGAGRRDFCNVIRAVVCGVDVAGIVDCYPVWSCAGGSQNC